MNGCNGECSSTLAIECSHRACSGDSASSSVAERYSYGKALSQKLMDLQVSSAKRTFALTLGVSKMLSGDLYEKTFAEYVTQYCVLQCPHSLANIPIVAQTILYKDCSIRCLTYFGHETAINLAGSTGGSSENQVCICSAG